MRFAVLLALASILTAVVVPARGQGLTILGVNADGDRPAVVAPPLAPPPLSVGERDALRARLHAGGQRTALILRGSNLGISEPVRALLSRVASAVGGDRALADFLASTLAKPYLTDEVPTEQALIAMGYRVEILASSQMLEDPAGFKRKVIEAFGRPDVSLVVFYGHGNTSAIRISGGKENSMPGEREIRRLLEDGHFPAEECLTVDDVVAARGAAGGLDGLIMHSCQSSTAVYIAERAGRPPESWARCVKADTGFLGAWATYAVYFTPDTSILLERYFAHAARVEAGDAALATSARAYVRTGGMIAKMARIGGLDDRAAYAKHGGDLSALEQDPRVIVHDEAQLAAADGLAAVIDFAYGVRFGPASLADDVRRFLAARQDYMDRHGFDPRVDGRPAPRLSAGATTAELNAVLAYYRAHILGDALSAAAPGLIELGQVDLALDAQDHLLVKLAGRVTSASQVDAAVNLLESVFAPRAAQATERALGPDLGPQLAPRVRATLDALARRLPDTLIDGRIALAVEKRVRPDANLLVPVVSSYSLTVGDVPPGELPGDDAPYRLCASLDSAGRLIAGALGELLGGEVELGRVVHAYARLESVGAVARVDASTLAVPLRWRVRVNWGPFGNGYAYATTRVALTLTPRDGLALAATPAVSIELERGWPAPDFLRDRVAAALSAAVTARLAGLTRSGLDLARLVPGAVRPEVAGAVRIRAVTVSEHAVTLDLVHAADLAPALGPTLAAAGGGGR